MDKTALRELVHAAMPNMVRNLGISDIHVTVTYDSLDGKLAGQCDVDARYLRAQITLDPNKLDPAVKTVEEGSPLYVLRHELLHVQQIRLIGYYQRFLPEDGKAEAVAFGDAIEEAVRRVEWMLDRMGVTPRKLAGERP